MRAAATVALLACAASLAAAITVTPSSGATAVACRSAAYPEYAPSNDTRTDCGSGRCELELYDGANRTVCICSENFLNEDGEPCKYERKSKLAAFMFSFWLGLFGVDRFYLARGHCGWICCGITKLFTCGGLFVWAFLDYVLILANVITDANGVELAKDM